MDCLVNQADRHVRIVHAAQFVSHSHRECCEWPGSEPLDLGNVRSVFAGGVIVRDETVWWVKLDGSAQSNTVRLLGRLRSLVCIRVEAAL